MRQNGKLVTDGTVDDMVSYSLSDKGRAEAARLLGAEPDGATITHRQAESSSASAGEPSAAMETKQAGKAVRSTRPKTAPNSLQADRKRVGKGKSGLGRVDHGGRRYIKK